MNGFMFEVKFKDGKIQKITIRAGFETEAVRMLKELHSNIISFKLLPS